MPTYIIPVRIEVDVEYEFEADNPQEAKKLAEKQAEKEYPSGAWMEIFEPNELQNV